MRIDGDVVKWKNGREENANCGYIGISREGGEITIAEGYDGGLPCGEPLTKVERVELSEHMILLWKLYAGQEVE